MKNWYLVLKIVLFFFMETSIMSLKKGKSKEGEINGNSRQIS